MAVAGRRWQARDVAVRVVTVDNHVPFLRVAEQLIEATPGFEFAAEASSGAEALEALEQVDAELVLVDLRMPGLDGVEVTRRIKADHPETVVVLISAADPHELASRAAGCGAAALVRKQDLAPDLLRDLWREHGQRA